MSNPVEFFKRFIPFSFNIFNPAFLILIEAFMSLSIFNPQVQIYFLSDSFKSSLILPQEEHNFEDGNHLSILTKYLFSLKHFHSRLERNSLKEKSRVTVFDNPLLN